jgi:hypothetical protein
MNDQLFVSFEKSVELELIKFGDFNFSKNILLFCTLRNECVRMPYFLEYYRNLGVEHFFFVDNNSTDGFVDLVKDDQDVTLYHTNHSYKDSNFGMDWLNFLLNKYGSGKWCITCDPDEFVVYPFCESLKLDQLTKILDANNQISLYGTMLDMYPKEDEVYKSGMNPLDCSPYFDKTGYTYKPNEYCDSVWAQGGVRSRLLFSDDPDGAPALNKIPLVKWSQDFYYISSMHHGFPNQMNASYKSGITGAVLHFKFLSTFKEKVEEEIQRKEHYNDSSEYKQYNSMIDNLEFYDPKFSVRYINTEQLIHLNLIKYDIS